MGIVLAIAMAIAFYWKYIPLPFSLTAVGILSIALVALVIQAGSIGPSLVADETGLTCYPLFYRTIAWEDVRAVIHVPRVEEYAVNNRRFKITTLGAWRPVDVLVHGIEKYSKLPPKVHQFLTRSRRRDNHPSFYPEEYPGCFRLRIEPAGQTGTSAELCKVIEHYISQNRKIPG